MRYFVFLLLVLIGMWSIESYAADARMSFRIQELGNNQYDYSAIWNPVTEEVLLRVGLVVDKVDPLLQDKEISFQTAREAQFIALDLPEIGENCEQVSQWHFDYQPGLPDYLMFVTLKGAGCQKVGEMFDILQVRLRFMGVSLLHFEPIDVAVDISR
ncbi:hypothetical protein QJS83_09085 [Bdellovibrio sp. 22V]|uniref:hypothetical protein n=1 Tax=Bdellovibrio TaxID=958 RepID=UPI002543DCC6|nr:hypothetical protein [Bdellovibrio sp. 22V]WII70610.1 hypothetical protein QJS83_09085 [Bdellovibrio sp. 22V]